MIRSFHVCFVIVAALLLAACSHFRMARQSIELRQIAEEWGFNKPHNPWIYAPLLCVVMLLSSCQTTPRAPDPFDVMLGEAAAAMFQDAPMMPNSLK